MCDLNVTWTCAYQGKDAPIAAQYAVSGYPTYLLIDAQGKIRARGHSSRSMDKKIAELLKEAKAR